MKAFVVAALSLFATASAAEPAISARRAHPVSIDSVQAVVLAGPWATTQIKVRATFGNGCQVPSADELVVFTNYSQGYSVLDLTLANTSDRICTMEYSPVTVTIDLGLFSRPNDGEFDQILVNDVEATVSYE